jgi:hypothetical protein
VGYFEMGMDGLQIELNWRFPYKFGYTRDDFGHGGGRRSRLVKKMLIEEVRSSM